VTRGRDGVTGRVDECLISADLRLFACPVGCDTPAERMVADDKTIEVARVRITEAGRRVLSSRTG
jgi:hypothetical protein